MEKLLAWLRQLEFGGVWQTLLIVAASLLCITFHELCHGLAAYRLGDPTAKRMGRLTLNPLRHVDIGGLVMMALCHFGWAKPVPIDARYFKKPKIGMAITALAGPLANVVLAYLAVMAYAVCMYFYISSDSAVLQMLIEFFAYLQIISTGLAVFNLFPIPPLDCSKILFAILPDTWYAKLMRYERFGMPVLAVLLLTGVLDTPLLYLRGGLLAFLQQTGTWPFDLLYTLLN